MSVLLLAAYLIMNQPPNDSTLLSYIRRVETDHGIRGNSTYLIMPVQLGGCNKCVSLNDNARNIALGCVTAKSELVTIQVVPIERQIEFSSIQKQYPYLKSIYPDIKRKLTIQYFSGVDACEALIVRNGVVIKIYNKSDSEQICRAVNGL